MYKNTLIIILAISTGLFAWLAIRNSTPIECSEVIQIKSSNLCIINMHELTAWELDEAIEQVKAESYKYNNE